VGTTREPVIIQVSRDEVENIDTSGVIGILDSFVPDLIDRNRNRVQIEVLGYADDPRELFDIPEIRRYFAKLFEDSDSLLFWIAIDSHMFIFLGLMLYEPVRVKGRVTLKPLHLQAFLQRAFVKLNRFCEQYQQSPEPTNELVRHAIRVEAD